MMKILIIILYILYWMRLNAALLLYSAWPTQSSIFLNFAAVYQFFCNILIPLSHFFIIFYFFFFFYFVWCNCMISFYSVRFLTHEKNLLISTSCHQIMSYSILLLFIWNFFKHEIKNFDFSIGNDTSVLFLLPKIFKKAKKLRAFFAVNLLFLILQKIKEMNRFSFWLFSDFTRRQDLTGRIWFK